MKKLLFSFILFALFSVPSYAFDQCDQVFDGGILRYESAYRFFDTFNNGENKDAYLNEYWVGYENPSYLDKGGAFWWTPAIKSSNYKVSKKSSMEVISTSSPNWKIAQHPTTRTKGTRSSYDFGISYTISYDFSNNYPNTADDISHKECVYYSVSWCGDGVLDSGYEQCDPNDPKKTGWWAWWCDNTCKPITTPIACENGGVYGTQPNPITSTTSGLCKTWVAVWDFTSTQNGTTTNYAWSCAGVSGPNCTANYTTTTPWKSCDLLSATPSNGPAPLTTNFSCSGTNTSSYRIEIQNSAGTVIRTINANTGNHTFSGTGNYTATCYADNLTSTSCQKPIVVTNTPISCENWGVYGAQPSPVTSTTSGLCRTGVVVWNFTSTQNGATTNYSWSCGWVSWPNCTASYTPIVPGSCENGWVYGAQSSIVTASTSGLCRPGVTVGNFTATQNGYTTNYAWSCAGVSWPNCTASYTPTVSPATCNNLVVSPTSWTLNPTNGVNSITSDFTCNATNAGMYRIEVRRSWWVLLQTINSSTGSYSFTTEGTYEVRCTINENITSAACTSWVVITRDTPPGGSSSSWSPPPTTSSSSSSWDSWVKNYCGDGKLQRPNDDGIMEECDFGTGTWPRWCSASCQITDSTTPGGITDIDNTTPGWGNLIFYPRGTLLIGDSMKVFNYLNDGKVPYIRNTSTSQVYINKKLCIVKTGFPYDSLSGDIKRCSTDVIGYLSAGGVKPINNFPSNSYQASTAGIPTNEPYAAWVLTTSLEGFKNMRSELQVRVARSSVNTFGGWAALLNGTSLSDISKLSQDFGPLKPEANKNLILSSMGVNPLSSYTKASQDKKVIDKSTTDTNKDLAWLSKKFTTGPITSIASLPATKYNGFDDIFIHRGDVKLASQSISGANKTYIIEDGNLTINGNITSKANILFVVKWGNIIIESGVTQIDAILIALPDGKVGGSIEWGAKSTTERLTINGAMYGKVGDLLSKRTYIKDAWAYVDVGTNVNFTSKVFTSPPPLLSQFLWDYLDGNKVPK